MKIWALGPFLLAGMSLSLAGSASDFNGDGTNDVGIFRAGSGLWSVQGITRAYLGSPGDAPVPGDYNCDGKAEIAVFRPASGLWSVKDWTRVYLGSAGDEPLGGLGGGNIWNILPGGISYSGNVGIGQGPAGAKLTLNSVSTVTDPQLTLCDFSTDYARLTLRNTRSDFFTLAAMPAVSPSDARLNIYYSGFGDMMSFAGDGNVDFGTGEHRAKLTVNGTVLLKAGAFNSASGYAGLYCHNQELYAIDGYGNVTLISPHDRDTGEWVFYSKNVKTGRVVKIDMERLVRMVEELTGEKFMVEEFEK